MKKMGTITAIAITAFWLCLGCEGGMEAATYKSGIENHIPSEPGNQPNDLPGEPNTSDDNLNDSHQFLSHLPKGTSQLNSLCNRQSEDKLRKAFCDEAAPNLTGMADLLETLDLSFDDPTGKNGLNGNPSFALLSHSVSLSRLGVSSLNPRAIVFSPLSELSSRSYTVSAFTRGEPFVELISKDPFTNQLHFYLLEFSLPCHLEGNCTPADLHTPNAEKNWQSWTLYEDVDLRNTSMDCMRCHQNSSGRKFLRMQQIKTPWTHWMRSSGEDTEGGLALLEDYFQAHTQAESYAGIPGNLIEQSNPELLESLMITEGFDFFQDYVFNGEVIEDEVKASAPGQPTINVPAGRSSTWDLLFAAQVSGDTTLVPYHDVKITDPKKLGEKSQAYRSFMAGQISESELPDLRDVFLEDRLHEMGMKPPSDADGSALLRQACLECHNSQVDPSLSRARFDVERIYQLENFALQEAIRRIQLDPSNKYSMPPRHIRYLDENHRSRLIQYLKGIMK